MSDYILIHNPACSKSRQTLEILEKANVSFRIYEYLKEELTIEFLASIFKRLDRKPADYLRKKEKIFLNLDLDLNNTDQIIKAVIKHPEILERPILLKGSRGVIGRPVENILDFINNSTY